MADRTSTDSDHDPMKPVMLYWDCDTPWPEDHERFKEEGTLTGISVHQLWDDGQTYTTRGEAEQFVVFAEQWYSDRGVVLERPPCLIDVPPPRPRRGAIPKVAMSSIMLEGRASEDEEGSPPAKVDRRPQPGRVATSHKLVGDVPNTTIPVTTTPDTPTWRPTPDESTPWWMLLGALLFLVGAILGEWPSVYYTFVRIAVSVCALFLTVNLWERWRGAGMVMLGTAILFNPIIPIYLHDLDVWRGIDAAAALTILVASVIERRYLKAERRAHAIAPTGSGDSPVS